MKLEEKHIISILGNIIHPVSKKNIVEMGLIKDLKLVSDKIEFTLSFSNFNDPLKTSIKNACIQILKENFDGNSEIEIKINDEIISVKKKENTILPGVKNIVAIASGKGGVGKSTVAVNLALALNLAGFKTGLIDADIFGPSVPKMLNSENEKPFFEKIEGKDLIIPVEKYGIRILSIGFFIDRTDATIWRGPMASNALKQLITESFWGELDYLLIDLPPGTSDIHLTLVQTVPVTGAVIVSTPQDVALADVIKGINMFKNNTINVPVLGLVENMAWFTPEELPDKKYYIFGKGGCRKLAADFNVPFLGEIPIVQKIRESGDSGKPVVLEKNFSSEAFKEICNNLVIQVNKRNELLSPTQKVEIKTIN